jgi:GT2 family glycosyltransferase
MKWEDKPVSIVILVMNEYDYFKHCMDSLIKYTDNYELIIIQNNSNNKIQEYIANLKLKILNLKVVYNSENKGFPYGCNQGIKLAIYPLILFLNSDTVVTPNWLTKLKRCFDKINNAGMVSPYVSESGGNKQQIREIFERRFLMSDNDIDNFAHIVSLQEDYLQCPITGSCFLVKREVFDKVGVFDYHKWLLGNEEEIEFQWRAMKLAGYYPYLCKGCYVHHYGNITWKEMKVDQAKYNIDNRIAFRNNQATTYKYNYVDNDVEIPSNKKQHGKIAWLADFKIATYKAGGAQYTNRCMIDYGIQLGYSIDLITPEDKLNNNYDLYILNNIKYFDHNFIKKIIKDKNYIRWEHDYWITGALPSFPDILDKSKLNLFMSKRHLQECCQIMDMEIPKATYCTSPINTDVFFIDTSIIKDNNLIIWTGHDDPDNKGFTHSVNFAQEHPDKIFKFFGKFTLEHKDLPDNMELIGEVDQSVFAKWLQRAKYVMALPNWIEPTGRSILEGLLCGCELIVNDNVGFLYEPIDFDNYDQLIWLAHSEQRFWNIIDGIL